MAQSVTTGLKRPARVSSSPARLPSATCSGLLANGFSGVRMTSEPALSTGSMRIGAGSGGTAPRCRDRYVTQPTKVPVEPSSESASRKFADVATPQSGAQAVSIMRRMRAITDASSRRSALGPVRGNFKTQELGVAPQESPHLILRAALAPPVPPLPNQKVKPRSSRMGPPFSRLTPLWNSASSVGTSGGISGCLCASFTDRVGLYHWAKNGSLGANTLSSVAVRSAHSRGDSFRGPQYAPT
ncbi:hypothetical protein A176_006918 [Myxococcus hansupus]|uniref:Uncharacterized protein n=1 Tax=Pseudomyxococcus hansupus TaxID=1297742 RepID=A0A0H4X300_9BACT|nr:hypothetical protein A176_006918 [Myxococcus hansupus]